MRLENYERRLYRDYSFQSQGFNRNVKELDALVRDSHSLDVYKPYLLVCLRIHLLLMFSELKYEGK